MKTVNECINEAIVKGKLKQYTKGLSLPVYKTIETIKIAPGTNLPDNDPTRYSVLVDNIELLNTLIDIIKPHPHTLKEIKYMFNDPDSKSKDSEHNIWLRPPFNENDKWIDNFYSEKDFNKYMKFVENIDIKNFNGTYWQTNYNK